VQIWCKYPGQDGNKIHFKLLIPSFQPLKRHNIRYNSRWTAPWVTVDQDVAGSTPVSHPLTPSSEGVFIKCCPLRGEGKGSSPFSHPSIRRPRHDGVFIKCCPLRRDDKGSSPFSHPSIRRPRHEGVLIKGCPLRGDDKLAQRAK